jgi:2,3-bisphosphoglycerate-independent phosphoglycerate mutase
VNYANCDMVGHTGVLEAAIEAVEAVDEGLGKVLAALRNRGGAAIITADHGNADQMLEDDGSSVFTAHTLSPVPFICVADGVSAVRDGGRLADVAPSVCDLLGIDPPAEWTGRSLLVREGTSRR